MKLGFFKKDLNRFIKELYGKKAEWYINEIAVEQKEVGKIKNAPIIKITESGNMADLSEGCGNFSFRENYFFFKGYRFYVLGSFGYKAKNNPIDCYIHFCIKSQVDLRKKSSFEEFASSVTLEYY